MKKLVIIQRKYNDGDFPSSSILGAVMTDKTEAQLLALWSEWQEECPQPDSDSQFIDWLIKEICFEKAEGWDTCTIRH